MIKTGCPVEVRNACTSLLTLVIKKKKNKKQHNFMVISGCPKIIRICTENDDGEFVANLKFPNILCKKKKNVVINS